MQAEQRIQRINQVLRCLRIVGKHIVRERDQRRLVEGVCANLIGNGCYQGAWIALIGPDKRVELLVQAGIETCVSALKKELEQGLWPPLSRKAIESKGVAVCKNREVECAGCPCLDLCTGRSGMVAPLRLGESLFGLICVQRVNGEIYPEEIGLFQEIADDVSYALYSLRALGESEMRFKGLVEHLPAIVYTASLGKEIIITYISPQVERYLGYSPEEFLWDPDLWFRCVHPDDRDRVAAEINKYGASENALCMEYRMRAKDGHVIWFRDEVVILEGRHGDNHGIQGIMLDITREKIALEDRRQMQSQLLQMQKMDAIGTLVAGVSHDFNNMLTAIQGYAELALMDLDEQSILYRQLRQIYGTSLRAADLVRKLLTFSRNRPLYMKAVDLNRLIKDFVKMLGRLLGEHIEIKTDLAQDLMPVYADLANIEQVLMNLSINAKDAMPSGGLLTFSTRNVDLSGSRALLPKGARPGDYVLISVEDNGVGMDRDVMERIFEPFFTTKEVGKGNGLGLSVTYGIIKDHHGWIECSSVPGEGSTFNVYLPAVPKDSGTVEKTVDIRSASAGWRGRHILVVEDEDAVRELVVEVLKMAGYRVSSAGTLSEARELCQKNQPWFDMLLADVVLPDGTGVELALELREQNPELRVLFSTGYTKVKALESLEDQSFYHLLRKPFSVADLLDIVASSFYGDEPDG